MKRTAPDKSSARAAIAATAVRHFAEHGFRGASIREILRDAGANVAAAHYHFGTKEALYREVVSNYLGKLCEERRIALEAIQTRQPESQGKRIAELVHAYVYPHIRLCTDPAARHYVQLLARFNTENDELTERIYTEILEPIRSAYLKALALVTPEIPTAERARLFSFMVSLMVTAPADTAYKSLTGRSPWPKYPKRLVEQIVEFVTAGILEAARSHGNAARSASPVSRQSRVAP